MRRLPSLFVSHGSPMMALEPSPARTFLAGLGTHLPRPGAILMVSAHHDAAYQGGRATVTSSPNPPTIHDFGGFPNELFAMRYPASGDPALAARIVDLLSSHGLAVTADPDRGLDHGAWVPLRHMLPAGDVPVFQLSLPLDLNAATALQLGQALAAVRAQGVAVVTTGSMTHNLYEVEFGAGPDSQVADYVLEFTRWVRDAVIHGNTAQLLSYRSLAPHAQRAHPSEEHFLPLLVAMGARSDAEPVQVLDGGTTYSVLAMESYAWGLPAAVH